MKLLKELYAYYNNITNEKSFKRYIIIVVTKYDILHVNETKNV